MEITNEIKAKVFAQYLGQKALTLYGVNIPPEGKAFVMRGVYPFDNSPFGESDFKVWGDDLSMSYNYHTMQLILRPLSAITDEDASWVAINEGWNPQVEHYLQDGKDNVKECLEHAGTATAGKHLLALTSWQYLQSKGYDLPHYLLGGKTLKEAGLAIYEVENVA